MKIDFLTGGSDAAVMWAHGLGPNQTTPSASAQAAPAPRLFSETAVGFDRRQSCLLLTQTTGEAASWPRFKYST